VLTRYSITCSHESCDWIGKLMPSLIEGAKAGEKIALLQKAWFVCPGCSRNLEVQIVDGVVKVLPIDDSRHDGSKTDAIPPLPPKKERAGNVRIITFAAGRGCRMEEVIAAQLGSQDEGESECHLLLDFTNVSSITSVELGTLIGLHKKMKTSGGRLTLFNLNLLVFEVFSITRLEKLLEICR
jgi:anti-anti-sigma factor